MYRSCPAVVVVVCALAAVLGRATDARAQSQYTRVSVASDGTSANGPSSHAVMSRNGRFVAFLSWASNLVPSDTNNENDVFVRDLVAHTTTRVSVRSDGSEGTGGTDVTLFPLAHLVGPGIGISDDGAIVAFSSRASLVPEDTNLCEIPGNHGVNNFINCTDIYVRDLGANQTTRVNVASDGTQANAESGDPQLSGDGRYVIFSSMASNLVAGDRNSAEDVFLHDRATHTTTRVSVSNTGGELNAGSYGGVISGDGRIVAFISEAPVTSDPDPVPCVTTPFGVPQCGRAFILDRSTGIVRRVPLPLGATSTGATVAGLALTPDGRFLAMSVQQWLANGTGLIQLTGAVVYDRQTGRADFNPNDGAARTDAIALNDSGRFLSVPTGMIVSVSAPKSGAIYDRLTNWYLSSIDYPFLNITAFEPIRLSADGLRVLFSDIASYVPEDTNTFSDVYVFNRDSDNDGMPDTFETQYGLKPNDPSDAALDADGDGVSNLQEYLNGTHPKGTFKRYFAEGAANSFFTTFLTVFNPGDQQTHFILEFLGSNGETRSFGLDLRPHARASVTLNDVTAFQPDNDFSTIIEADQPLVVDRTMTWDKSGYGSHAETAIESPSATWYLAEGSTGGSFDLFYLLQNPGDVAANVTINYLRPAPAAPIVKDYIVEPRSRRTIYVDQEGFALAATDLSAKITSDQPILAERAMYFSTPTQPFAAGHEGAAVASPSTTWFLAEGATGSFFDLFVLIGNAEANDAQIKATYLLPNDAPIVKTYSVAAHSRLTINVDFEDPKLRDTPVSTIIESTNAVPVVVERAMWWPSPNWYEAHLSAGSTTTGTKWALAEGEVRTVPGIEAETYILIANTAATASQTRVTLYFDDGTTASRTFAIPASGRFNVQTSVEFPEAKGKRFSSIVESDGAPIVVERAMYSNANGQTWVAGTDALATKLQ